MSSRQRSHRLALYNWCFTERISATRGTPYPCNQHDLDRCDFGSDRPPHSLQTQDHATTYLEHFLDPNAPISSTVQAAMVRLQAALRIHDWKPDLIIKAFNDLDIVFFDGKLRGRTTIHWRRGSWWAELERSRGRPHKSFAVTRSLHHRRAAIELNAWGMFMNTADAKVAMWKITLHEMVLYLYSPTIQHAYQEVTCGPGFATQYDHSRGWHDGHGLMFRRLVHAVHERAMHHLGIPAIERNRYEY
ncbi:hypothetical protein MMC22_007762 [Lobaria immixta]|nr:hypothetical protein [Lobaria immixta]